MARLPQVGGDQGSWGQILNDYLSTSHNSDGTLKAQSDIDDAKGKADSAVQSVNGKTGTSVTLSAADVSAEPAGLSDDTKAQLNDTFVVPTSAHMHDAQVIDICEAPFNCVPGDDITTALQTAINTIAATGQSGEVLISKVGTYLLSGPLQTGTYTGAETYTWNAQVLFPAIPFANSKTVAITIRGGVRAPAGGWDSTGDPSGVTIQSAITSGFMFETVPGYDGWGKSWTGIMPAFEDIVFRLPDNPTAGVLNLRHALRTRLERLNCLTQNSWVIPSAGSISSAVAIALPQLLENGDVTIRDVDVRGYPTAFWISEHGVFDNVQIVDCQVAFYSTGGGHRNWLGYVDVEECATVFYVAAGTSNALAVYGFLDVETNSTWPYMILADDETGLGQISGKIDLSVGNSGAPGSRGTTRSLEVANPNHNSASTWSSQHPRDNFLRSGGGALTGVAQGAPGYSWPTMHPWRAQAGDFAITAASGGHGTMKSAATISRALVPVLDAQFGGRSRSIEATFAAAATGTMSFSVLACRKYDSGTTIYASVKNGTLYLGVGTFSSGAGLASVAGVVTAGQTVTVRLEVVNSLGQPKIVNVYLNGVKQLSHTLTAAEAASLTSSTTSPYMEDGIGWSDGDETTTISSFVVRGLEQAVNLSSGLATLAAGIVAIPDTQITASSIVRLSRQAAGGTLGELSVALTAGTGFAINSNNAADTSTVYYEVVTY